MTIASVEFQKFGNLPTEVTLWHWIDGKPRIVSIFTPPSRWIVGLRRYLITAIHWEPSRTFWASDRCVRVEYNYVEGGCND